MVQLLVTRRRLDHEIALSAACKRCPAHHPLPHTPTCCDTAACDRCDRAVGDKIPMENGNFSYFQVCTPHFPP